MALSHSASAKGMILLPDFTNPNLTAFDPKEIQGGCSGHLKQEFHELELLDYIILMLYKAALSMKVYGNPIQPMECSTFVWDIKKWLIYSWTWMVQVPG